MYRTAKGKHRANRALLTLVGAPPPPRQIRRRLHMSGTNASAEIRVVPKGTCFVVAPAVQLLEGCPQRVHRLAEHKSRWSTSRRNTTVWDRKAQRPQRLREEGRGHEMTLVLSWQGKVLTARQDSNWGSPIHFFCLAFRWEGWAATILMFVWVRTFPPFPTAFWSNVLMEPMVEKRPVPRLLHWKCLLKAIAHTTPSVHLNFRPHPLPQEI